MRQNKPSCIKCVDEDSIMVKNGKTKYGKQRYLCKSCNKTMVEKYTYNAYRSDINKNIVILTKEGLGIRSTARVLQISAATLLKRIVKIAKNISQPPIVKRQEYELDEVRTYIKVKSNFIWIVYALEKLTKRVVNFTVGRRTNETLKKVIKNLELSEAKKIFTDKLRNYKYLINPEIHSTKNRGINHIERKNLTLRTHIKRLNRKTICFSRSAIILSAILKIYFWS